MWVFILTMVMVFGGLTSAYIVSRSFTDVSKLVAFELPSVLNLTTLVILLSSASMVYATSKARKGDRNAALTGILITFVLGVLFLIGQFYAWKLMVDSNHFFVHKGREDNSIAFFYVFTGLHGLHIVGALLALLFGIVLTFLNKYKPGRMSLTYEVIGTFWHFLGLLWVYLYLFLIYNH